jgi:hypothetical protein
VWTALGEDVLTGRISDVRRSCLDAALVGASSTLDLAAPQTTLLDPTNVQSIVHDAYDRIVFALAGRQGRPPGGTWSTTTGCGRRAAGRGSVKRGARSDDRASCVPPT